MAKDKLKKKQAKDKVAARDAAAKGGEGGDGESDAPSSASELLEALDHIREGGFMDNNRVTRLAQIFSDDVTLDNAPRPQLVQMCRYGPEVELPTLEWTLFLYGIVFVN